MPVIINFDFGKERVRIRLADEGGRIILDRLEGVLHFDTTLRKIKIRLIPGSRFFMGKAAGYTGFMYIRLKMPPGYGPIRSLGRASADDANAKLFIDLANSCIPSEPLGK
ncbi:MAG: hypothetical protein ACYS8W_01235 [Planctomycetota bacterium]|jgi:hypothetical protein